MLLKWKFIVRNRERNKQLQKEGCGSYPFPSIQKIWENMRFSKLEYPSETTEWNEIISITKYLILLFNCFLRIYWYSQNETSLSNQMINRTWHIPITYCYLLQLEPISLLPHSLLSFFLWPWQCMIYYLLNFDPSYASS